MNGWLWRRVQGRLEHVVPPASRASVIGDLQEDYARQRASTNRLRANLWLWREFRSLARAYRTTASPAPAAWRPGTGWLADVRFALRRLGASPAFAVVAVLTLAIGIGANTSAFSIMNAVLLRPLPYPDHQRLDRIFRVTAQDSRGGVSPVDYVEARELMAGYGEIAAYGAADVSLAERDTPAEAATGARVSANFLSLLGVGSQLGRGFRADEDVAGNHRVLILSNRYWQHRFAGDPSVIGRIVRVDGEPHEIIGVLPAEANDFRHLGPFDVFRPLGFTDQEQRDRTATWLRIVGRRSTGLTGTQGEQLVADVGRRLAADHPTAHAGSTWRARPLAATVIPDNAPGVLFMLIGLSGIVLLIACSNLANLLLARTITRAREFAVRAALGASRARVLRPLIAESLLLALAGGIGSIYVTMGTNSWLNGFSARGGGDPTIFSVNWRVLIWGAVAGLVTALVFSLAPALFALRLDPHLELKSGSRGSTAGRGHQRLRKVLIAGQFAFALVLLAGAAVFGRGLYELNHRQYGWEAERLVSGTVILPPAQYASEQEISNFQRLALERLRTLPGAESSSISHSMPFFGLTGARKYVVDGAAPPEPGGEPAAVVNGISPDYFETVGTRVLSGRRFTERDTAASPRVFIVNQSMARGLFGNDSPLGSRITEAGRPALDWGEIVGVAADIESVVPERIAVRYQVYQPLAQEPRRAMEVAVRSAGTAPEVLAGGIRAAIAELDPDLPVRRLQPADVTIAGGQRYAVIIGSLLAFLAVLGVGLASLGIFSVISHTVAQRRGEFSIRLALGARAADITRLVVVSGSKLASAGSVIGLAGAFGVARAIAAGWPGMATGSVPMLASAALFVVAIGLVACYVPARWAAKVRLDRALRSE